MNWPGEEVKVGQRVKWIGGDFEGEESTIVAVDETYDEVTVDDGEGNLEEVCIEELSLLPSAEETAQTFEQWFGSEKSIRHEDNPMYRMVKHFAREAWDAALSTRSGKSYEILRALVADEAFAELCQDIGEEPQWLKDARAFLRPTEAPVPAEEDSRG